MDERLTFEGNFCEIAKCREQRWGKHCPDGACSQRKVWERLKEYEDSEAVPVVRCKDCKYKDTWTESPKIRDWFWCGVSGLQVVEDMDFFSYGERKNNGNKDRA